MDRKNRTYNCEIKYLASLLHDLVTVLAPRMLM